MRIVVTGATGNVGTALVAELLAGPSVDTVVGVARRPPGGQHTDDRNTHARSNGARHTGPGRTGDRQTGADRTVAGRTGAGWTGDRGAGDHGTGDQGTADRAAGDRAVGATWWSADVAGDELGPAFRDADALVHLAWMSRPTRRPATTWAVNVLGTKRVLRAAVDAGIGTVVVASSAGAYSPRTSLDPVDESWPTDGVPTVAHSREKAYVERLLDAFERDYPEVRLVRLRPAFIFRPATTPASATVPAPGTAQVPGAAPVPRTMPATVRATVRATAPGRLVGGLTAADHRRLSRLRTPVLPDLRDGLSFQALHAADVARAYCQAVHRDVHGAFNLAADPVIDLSSLAGRLGLPLVRVPLSVARVLLTAASSARLLPGAPHLLDLLRRMPLLDATRARDVLGWTPQLSSYDALWER